MQTACLLKPDVYPIYAGELISRIIGQGFTVKLAGELELDQLMLDGWYHEHVGRDYYEKLSAFMQEGPVFGLVLEHPKSGDPIRRLRNIMGPTKIEERDPREIRGEFGDPEKIERNAIHGSDSETAAEYEVGLLRAWLAR